MKRRRMKRDQAYEGSRTRIKTNSEDKVKRVKKNETKNTWKQRKMKRSET